MTQSVGIFGVPILQLTGGYLMQQAVDSESGAAFKQFEVDWLADESVGYCACCETAIESGWLCLDDGAVYCDNCVVLIDVDDDDKEEELYNLSQIQRDFVPAYML